MIIKNPLKPPTKRKKKETRTEKFVDALEDQMFATQDAAFGTPASDTPQTEILNTKTLGLQNVSVRRKVIEYLPQVEKLKSLILEGRTLKQAMQECNIPDTLEVRKALGKAFELDLIIEFRSSPELEKMLVQAARMKFLREATLRGDSKNALKWAMLIQGDSEVFEQKKEIPAVFMNKNDLAAFLDKETTEEAIEADFELILDQASIGEKKDE